MLSFRRDSISLSNGWFCSQPLPRVDSLGSRSFLIRLMPHLSNVPSALRALEPPNYARRIRALDVGAVRSLPFPNFHANALTPSRVLELDSFPLQ